VSINLFNNIPLHGLTLLGLIVLTACGNDTAPEKPGGMGRGGPVTVYATKVEAQKFTDEFTALGTAWSNESIEVTSRISSVVDRIVFEEGQDVAVNDLLVELDNRDLKAGVSMAEASLQKVRSQFERRKSLGATKVISEDELEELAAEVRIAEAELHGAQAQLSTSYVRAPFAGTLGLRRVSPGDVVNTETIITTLDDVDTMKLQFAVPEAFMGSLAKGLPVVAISQVYPDRPFTGSVISIDSRVDPATRSIAVIARMPNPDRLLRPGMFLTVKIQRERHDVLMIPEQSLVPKQGRQFVFIIEDGKAVEKEVQLGARAPGKAEISQGITAGDIVVTEGTQKLRNGSSVLIAQHD